MMVKEKMKKKMKNYLWLLINIAFLVTLFYVPKTQLGIWVSAIIVILALIVNVTDIFSFISKSRKQNE